MFNNFNIEALTLRLINISQWENSIFFKATPELDIIDIETELDIIDIETELDIIDIETELDIIDTQLDTQGTTELDIFFLYKYQSYSRTRYFFSLQISKLLQNSIFF